MKCHHCRHDYPETWDEIYIGKDTLDRDESYHDRDQQRTWLVRKVKCPECKKLIIVLREVRGHFDAEGPELRDPTHILGDKLIRPEQASKEPLPSEAPSELAEDYYEACRVLPISAKASAALSRRCLQNFLREVIKVKPDDLAIEIKEVLEKRTLPSHLAEAIDGVRNIGNFATHPIKSKNTGEILNVESGEAEWLLDTLEGLFEFHFVQPAKLREKREALNAKLKEAGKPPIR